MCSRIKIFKVNSHSISTSCMKFLLFLKIRKKTMLITPLDALFNHILLQECSILHPTLSELEENITKQFGVYTGLRTACSNLWSYKKSRPYAWQTSSSTCAVEQGGSTAAVLWIAIFYIGFQVILISVMRSASKFLSVNFSPASI